MDFYFYFSNHSMHSTVHHRLKTAITKKIVLLAAPQAVGVCNVAFITKATPDTADSHGCSWLVSSSYPQAVSAKPSVHHTWKFQCLLTFLEAMTPKVFFPVWSSAIFFYLFKSAGRDEAS